MYGLLCRRCGAECCEGICESDPAELECPFCNGEECKHCVDGHIQITQCGKRYVDAALVKAINFSEHIDKGLLPISGGLLDQSAWFLSVWQALSQDKALIEAKRIKEGG